MLRVRTQLRVNLMPKPNLSLTPNPSPTLPVWPKLSRSVVVVVVAVIATIIMFQLVFTIAIIVVTTVIIITMLLVMSPITSLVMLLLPMALNVFGFQVLGNVFNGVQLLHLSINLSQLPSRLSRFRSHGAKRTRGCALRRTPLFACHGWCVVRSRHRSRHMFQSHQLHPRLASIGARRMRR